MVGTVVTSTRCNAGKAVVLSTKSCLSQKTPPTMNFYIAHLRHAAVRPAAPAAAAAAAVHCDTGKRETTTHSHTSKPPPYHLPRPMPSGGHQLHSTHPAPRCCQSLSDSRQTAHGSAWQSSPAAPCAAARVACAGGTALHQQLRGWQALLELRRRPAARTSKA